MQDFMNRELLHAADAELYAAMEEMNRPEEKADWELDPLCGMTMEEYQELYERIRAELIEELLHSGEVLAQEK